MPKVSIIIPNYCHSQYLDERIQSILSQTYKNFELIILDDCSPDEGKSKAVIEKYRNIPCVSHIVYNDKNSGSTFKQWDLGLSLAKGELIWIAESDDSCDPNLLASLVEEFNKYPKTVFAYTTSCHMDTDGQILMTPRKRKNRHYSGSQFIRRYMSMGNSVQNASSCIFRKNLALSVDRLYTSYRGAGDRLFWILLAEQGEVSIVNKGLNYFRKHCSNTTAKCYADGSNFFEDKEIFDYISSKGLMGYFNKCGAKWYVYEKCKRIQFVDKIVAQKVYNVWRLNRFECFVGGVYIQIVRLFNNFQLLKDIVLDQTNN